MLKSSLNKNEKKFEFLFPIGRAKNIFERPKNLPYLANIYKSVVSVINKGMLLSVKINCNKKNALTWLNNRHRVRASHTNGCVSGWIT